MLKYLIEEQEYPVTEVLVNYVKGENYSNQYYEVAAKYIDSYLLQKKLANEMTQENKTNKPKKI